MDIIKKFYSIRDIPYSIPKINEKDNSCAGKHKKLFDFFKQKKYYEKARARRMD